MKKFKPTYKRFSEDSILVVWPEIISDEILHDIRSFVERINEQKLDFIKELNFVYNSLLVLYDSRKMKHNEVVEKLKTIYSENKNKCYKAHKWLIPVCYDISFGIDIENIATKNNISIQEIVQIHQETTYTIHGIGFLPGFLYLGGLSEKLHLPRLKIPRPFIEKGAVGIGGTQTGIYPQKSPGGWNIIGNTPISMFNIHKKTPCEFTPGDKIKFEAINLEAYNLIKNEVELGSYNLKKIAI